MGAEMNSTFFKAWLPCVLCAAVWAGDVPLKASAPSVSLFAGHLPGAGHVDGKGREARFREPDLLAFGPKGELYVVDKGNACLRRIRSAGEVETLRIKPSDESVSVLFGSATDMVVDSLGNVILVRCGCLYQISPEGIPKALDHATRQIGFASGLVADGNENIYVSDSEKHAIWKINQKSQVSLLAGKVGVEGCANGRGGQARFKVPTAMTPCPEGGFLIFDSGNNSLRHMDRSGAITRPPIMAMLEKSEMWQDPTAAISKIRMDPKGRLYLLGNRLFCRIESDGSPNFGVFLNPDYDVPLMFHTWNSMAFDADSSIYLSSGHSHAIYRIASGQEKPTLFAGRPHISGFKDGKKEEASFLSLGEVVMNGLGEVHVLDAESKAVRKITRDGCVSTPKAWGEVVSDERLRLASDGKGRVFVADVDRNCIQRIEPGECVSTLIRDVGEFGKRQEDAPSPFPAFFREQIEGLAADGHGNIYATLAGSHCVFKFDSSGTFSFLAGRKYGDGRRDGDREKARFRKPALLAAGSDGCVFVTEVDSRKIRKIARDGAVSTLNCEFERVDAMVTDSTGNFFILDAGAGSIFKVAPDATVALVASCGQGTSVPWKPKAEGEKDGSDLRGIAITPEGDLLATLATGVVKIALEKR